MKRFLLSLVAILITTVGFAQDVIVMKDGSTIQSKVTKVTKSEVEYKKFDNQAGPTYTIKTKELQCINYENGTKDTFVAPGYDPNIVTNETATQYSNDKELLEIYNSQKKGSKKKSAAKESTKREVAKRNTTKKDVTPRIVTPEMRYNRGKKMKVAGYTIGGTLLAAGLASVIIGVTQDKYEHVYVTNNCIHGEYNYDRAILLYTGCGAVATGVTVGLPLMLKGSALQKKNRDLIHSASAVSRDINFSNGSSINLGIDVLSNSFLYTNTPGIGVRYNF